MLRTISYRLSIVLIIVSSFCCLQAKKEGFRAGTLVRTACGYQPIETIKESDVIIGVDGQGNQVRQLVQRAQCEKIKKYVRLFIDDQVIEAAPHQRFLESTKNRWVSAKKLAAAQNISAERVKKKALVYQLTVSGHQFYITPQDIRAHNASIAVAQCARVVLQYLTLTDPVQATLGAGMNFDTIKTQINKQMPGLAQIEKSIQGPAAKKEYAADVLKARNDYLQRRQALIQLRDKFIQVKTDMEYQSRLFKAISWTDCILIKVNLNLELVNNPTLEQEANFNAQKTYELGRLRGFELMRLEEQIKELQIHLGIHFEAVCKQYLDSLQKYEESYEHLGKFVNNQTEESLPIILECFDRTVTCEFYLKKFEENINTAKIIFSYYKNSAQASVLRETSNIKDILDNEIQILECERRVAHEKNKINSIKSMIDPELRYRGINMGERAENYYNHYRAQDNGLKSQMIQDIEKKRLTSQYPIENPQKDCFYAQDNKDAVADKQKKIIEDLSKNAKPGKETSDTTKQLELPGEFEDAVKDFDSLDLDDIQAISTGKRGMLKDGRMVNVRYKSKDSRPTLEIYDPTTKKSIKFRYGNKKV